MTVNLDELRRLYEQAVKEFNNVDRMFAIKEENGIEIKYREPIINLLFWNIIEKVDALIVLFENKVGKSADSIVRDLFENYIYLLFMITKDDDRYARAYVYQTYIEEIRTIERYMHDLEQEKQVVDQGSVDRLEWLKSRISDNKFSEIRVNWDSMKQRLKKERRPPFPKWYNLFDGPTTFKKVCKDLGYEKHFEDIYNGLSHQTHTLNILDSLSQENHDWGYVREIRNGKDSNLRSMISKFFATRALVHFVRYFHKDKKEYYRDIFIKINPNNRRLFK